MESWTIEKEADDLHSQVYPIFFLQAEAWQQTNDSTQSNWVVWISFEKEKLMRKFTVFQFDKTTIWPFWKKHAVSKNNHLSVIEFEKLFKNIWRNR